MDNSTSESHLRQEQAPKGRSGSRPTLNGAALVRTGDVPTGLASHFATPLSRSATSPQLQGHPREDPGRSRSLCDDPIFTPADPPWGLRSDPRERRFIERWRERYNQNEDRERRFMHWVSFIKELDRRIGFEWWVTLTFRGPVHTEAALKCLGRWEHKINRKVYGVRYTRRGEGISSIVAIEYQKRGVLHFHALTGGTKLPPRRGPLEADHLHVRDDGVREFRRLTAMDWWEDMAGIARIYPYRRAGGAEEYVSKYVVKDGHIFPSGPFNAQTPDLMHTSTERAEGRS